MAMNLQMDTSGLEQIERPVPRAMPPLDLQPQKSPYYIGQLPTTATVNPDAVRNFATPGIPSYRITPAAPLNVAGSVVNAVAGATITPTILQPVPSPAIQSPLATTPTGYTFSFSEVRLPLSGASSISSYKIYRNSSNDFSSAVTIRGIVHHTDTLANPVVVTDPVPNGQTRFYWVTAVSTQGGESSPTPAQSDPITSKAGFNANSQVASSFNCVPLNTNFASLAGSPSLSNTGTTTTIVISANSNAFAPGNLVYNSGSVNSTLYGNHVIMALDPSFSGGAVIYTFGFTLQQQINDANILMGQILTSPTAASSCGGQTGGTTGQKGIGARGVALP